MVNLGHFASRGGVIGGMSRYRLCHDAPVDLLSRKVLGQLHPDAQCRCARQKDAIIHHRNFTDIAEIFDYNWKRPKDDAFPRPFFVPIIADELVKAKPLLLVVCRNHGPKPGGIFVSRVQIAIAQRGDAVPADVEKRNPACILEH
ncbi:hypothetical protein RM190_11465 [Paracoccus sp. CPCC 101403]|uniref:Uncharacterized protein n=1 Tax=Paracoccus broussonetiae TaxID=3075834 RepID=A0ABU3EE23_9RHOB|nr:hypothetical protein [Paracoccus sp. CPCC 101403]MDT1062484.1 hypothetical protein [Paracoccus sp. CPCC 101403]